MANRKVLIESIIGLAQKLGANPSKFMGTKGNINFLGTGDRAMKGTTFSGLLNEEMIGATNAFGKSDLVKIIEQDAGYVTAGKLNDVQLNTMFTNLKTIDRTFNPPPLPPGPMNVIDLETGTRNINKEGLESLRDTDKIKRFTQGLGTSKTAMSDKIKKGIESIKTKLTRDYGGDEIATKATAENNFIRSGAADFGDSIAAEGGRRAVVRQVMKNNANYFGLTPEIAESIAKSKDLGKGGSQFADPLLVFREKGNFTRQELEKIDEIIEANPFDDVKNIADKVSDYLQSIRPDGFADGGRIGYRSGGIGRLMSEGIKTAMKRTRKGYDTPGADFQVLTEDASYLMSPPNMQMLEKLKIIRRQLVRDIKRKEGGGKYTFGPDPKGTKKDLQSLDEYIADLKKKISVEGYYGEGREAEKALLESDSSLPFSKLVKDRYRSADGGRIGFKSGKSVKDGIAALLKLGNKKFGKDTLKTADDIEPSEFSKFNERNKVLDDLDIEDYTDELGDPETWYTFGMTAREADELVKSRKAYEAQMFTDYKAGRLDPKPGEPGRKKLLEKKAEDAEMSGDSRLFTPDEADELTMLEAGPGPSYGGIKNAEVPMELMTVDIIKVKYPQIPDEMAEMIASLPNDKKALAIADLEQAIMLQGSGRSSDEIIEIMKREPKTKMKKGGLAQILEM